MNGIFDSLKNGTSFNIVLHSNGGEVKIEGVNDLDERSRQILLQGGLAAYTRNGGQ